MQPAPDPAPGAQDLHLTFPADPFAVREALARMLALPPLCTLGPDGRGTAEIVLAEVLNNIAEHAYVDRVGPVAVTIAAGAQGVSCLLVDEGRAMPDNRLPAGRLPASRLPDGQTVELVDLPEGGFGWHLIRSLTRNLTYARVDGQNRVSFLLPRDG